MQASKASGSIYFVVICSVAFGAGKQGEWQYLLCCNLQCCLVQSSKASGNIYFVVICSVVFGAGKQGEWQYLLCCNLQCCVWCRQARRVAVSTLL